MTPEVARVVATGAYWKAPSRIMNSPTNPFVPGSAMDERVTIMKVKANSGTTLVSPP